MRGGERVRRLCWALPLLCLACAYPLLEDGEDEAASEANAVRTTVQAFAQRLASPPPPAAQPQAAAPEGEPSESDESERDPAGDQARAPLDAEQIAARLDEARELLRASEIKLRPRDTPRGPLPAGSALREAYREGRAINLEGRFEQVREWAALAKFASEEPGAELRRGPLAGYDLVITLSDKKKGPQLAYLHIVVPPRGLAQGPDAHGEHEAWVAGERWVNLSDYITPGRDYLVFKSNTEESLHRQWGAVSTIESVVEIAAEYRQRTGLPLGVGDISHVTGGKISDHWTHQHGVDADLYLLDPADTDKDGRPRVWWSHIKRGVSMWTSKPKGKGEREPRLDPNDELSLTATSQRLRILAQIVFEIDAVAYFVHNDANVLAPFDEQVGDRRPGRRFLHADNRGYWPTHADHVHLRWVEGKLPVDVTPRP
ncbi:penicillin-insensitive murein endopeptidase [Pseudenhygromyxa sp. WMMC2535]|uniref:penicillin-insensitive murein endopeptidase n=1 Tax=Pseudenhygromyxa sp. WMMC2535 TaxID=2712867 RepID=UPI001556A277|nr:penicillin-insensitive murein endopeptidase [Pseudenhygromyxa sp. WMMC2535]NVB42576.1 penicillin-insensitive murein endopeptidase [Pseudenhygromyxa sp. WMMC2535]